MKSKKVARIRVGIYEKWKLELGIYEEKKLTKVRVRK